VREPRQRFCRRLRFVPSAGFKKTRAASGARFDRRHANRHACVSWIFGAEQPLPISPRGFAEGAIAKVQRFAKSANDFGLGKLSLKRCFFRWLPLHRLLSKQEADRRFAGRELYGGRCRAGAGAPREGGRSAAIQEHGNTCAELASA